MEKLRVKLSRADRAYLQAYIGKGRHPARAIRRARILLGLSGGDKSQKQVARECHCSEATVSYLLKRYRVCKSVVEEVLAEKPRSGQPTVLTPELEAHITTLACSGEGPEGRSGWTLELIAGKMVRDGLAVHLSHETVRKVLKKAGSNRG